MMHYILNDKGIDYLNRNYDKKTATVDFLKYIVEKMQRDGAFAPSDSILSFNENSTENRVWRSIQKMGLVDIEDISGEHGSKFIYEPLSLDHEGSVKININGKLIDVDKYLGSKISR